MHIWSSFVFFLPIVVIVVARLEIPIQFNLNDVRSSETATANSAAAATASAACAEPSVNMKTSEMNQTSTAVPRRQTGGDIGPTTADGMPIVLRSVSSTFVCSLNHVFISERYAYSITFAGSGRRFASQVVQTNVQHIA